MRTTISAIPAVSGYGHTLALRATNAVARKLDCHVTFCRWDKTPLGDVPVFYVPADRVGDAVALGLNVVAISGVSR